MEPKNSAVVDFGTKSVFPSRGLGSALRGVGDCAQHLVSLDPCLC